MTRALVLVALLLAGACGNGGADDAPGASANDEGVPLPSFRDVDPDVVRAVEEAHAAVVANRSDGTAWGALADRYAAHQFLAESIACYEKAAELDPGSYVWSYRLGWMRFMAGADGAAAPIAQALESLGDAYAPAHEAYGQVLVREGREDEALEQFLTAARIDPSNAHAETGAGLILMGRGETDEALKHLEAAVVADPNHGEAHLALARLYLSLGREEDGRRHAEISRGLPQISPRADMLVNPSIEAAGPTARTSYGMVLEQQGDMAGAEEQYRIALESNANSYQARRRLAMLMEKSGRRDDAIALLQEAEDNGTATDQTTDLLQKFLKRQQRKERRQAGEDEPEE